MIRESSGRFPVFSQSFSIPYSLSYLVCVCGWRSSRRDPATLLNSRVNRYDHKMIQQQRRCRGERTCDVGWISRCCLVEQKGKDFGFFKIRIWLGRNEGEKNEKRDGKRFVSWVDGLSLILHNEERCVDCFFFLL